MNDTRLLFERVLTDEPPLTLTLEPVVAAGRRVRRRRAALAGSAFVAGSVVALLALPLGRPTSLEPTRPAASTTAAPDDLTPAQRAIADAIVAASPAGWTFDLSADRWSGNALDTTVDDGDGPTWFYLHPDTPAPDGCAADGADGLVCIEGKPGDDRRLGMLWMRDSNGPGGEQRVVVVFAGPDGIAVTANTSNYVKTGAKATTVTRAEPTFSQDQLSRVVAAVDEAYAPYR